MWCHLLLFMPAVGLGLFVILPWEVALPAYAILSGVSLFVYYKIMRAMSQPVQVGREALLGSTATVLTGNGILGQVRCGKEVWTAVSEERLKPGLPVRIVGFKGMKLIVSRDEETGIETSRRRHCG